MKRLRTIVLLLGAFLFGAVDQWAGGIHLKAADPAASPHENDEMARMRKKAKERRRRLIYNNDGNDIFLKIHENPKSFLSQRIIPALNTQVDSIFYCTGGTTVYDHDTNVAQRSDDLHERMNFNAPQSVNRHANMRMLRRAGVDSLSLVTKHVHEAGLEVFWTHRINDIHDSFTDWLFSDWKREHPQYLMGTPDDKKRHDISHPRYMWSTLDFEKPEVLDYLYRITEEVCQRYDVDGIEIDYFRHPLFFRPNLQYKPATPVQVEIMTGFQRRIREMAYLEGNRRGRPILVAAHVPMSRQTCLHVGIDLERWLRDDLLDVLVAGSGYQPMSMPTKKIAELGHAHGVPVYPNISNSGMEQWSGRVEAWRAAASNVWQAGADGMNLFNWFPGAQNDPLFTTLGDPQTLAGLDKVFGIDNMREYYGCLEQGVVQSQILPVEFGRSGKPREVNLPLGDDIAAAAKAGNLKKVTLRVQFVSRTADDKVELYLNGNLVEPESEDTKEGWVTYRPEPRQYVPGDNTISFRLTAARPGRKVSISLRSIELDVDYR